MSETKEWYSAAKIAGCAGAPTTARSVNRMAEREGWRRRKRQHGKGWEYHINSLPSVTRSHLLSEPPPMNRNAVPILAPGIGTRIKAAADRIGTRANAAAAAGVSDDMLYRYIREESPPSFAAMAGLACAAGVSLEWIATGEPPMRRGELRAEESADLVYRQAVAALPAPVVEQAPWYVRALARLLRPVVLEILRLERRP